MLIRAHRLYGMLLFVLWNIAIKYPTFIYQPHWHADAVGNNIASQPWGPWFNPEHGLVSLSEILCMFSSCSHGFNFLLPPKHMLGWQVDWLRWISLVNVHVLCDGVVCHSGCIPTLLPVFPWLALYPKRSYLVKAVTKDEWMNFPEAAVIKICPNAM